MVSVSAGLIYSCFDSGWQLKGWTRLLSPISLPKAVGLLVAAGWLQKGRDKAAKSLYSCRKAVRLLVAVGVICGGRYLHGGYGISAR